jgi:uncharacterized protein YheU (UPF0270 family)
MKHCKVWWKASFCAKAQTGEVEITMQEKVDQIIEQLRLGDIVIEYSEEHESVNIIKKP